MVAGSDHHMPADICGLKPNVIDTPGGFGYTYSGAGIDNNRQTTFGSNDNETSQFSGSVGIPEKNTDSGKMNTRR